MVTSAARLLAWYRSSCAKPWLTVKWRWTDINLQIQETREYILASSHLPETRRRRQVPFNKLIGAFEKCTNSLDSRAVDDSAVHYCSSWIHKATGWISLPSIRIFLDQRKVVTIEGHPGRSRTRSSFSWLSFSQRVNRVLCTGVGVVMYLQYCVGGTWLKCIK
jgi:hypothetical protein